MFYLIYKITNTINNKIYIGKHQTKDKNDELKENKSINKEDLNQWIEKGWKKGCKMKYHKKFLDND